jgi:hypothetical protein
VTHPPHLTAALDQARCRARDELDTLVALARLHKQGDGCTEAVACVGPAATAWLVGHTDRAVVIAATAIARLAEETTP